MKTDKICISQKISFIALSGIIIVSFIVLTLFIGKTHISSNTRAAESQCIYRNMRECIDTCKGLCTKASCNLGRYQCREKMNVESSESINGICPPYGTKFMKSLKYGGCMSIGSKVQTEKKESIAYKGSYDTEYRCVNEPAKDADLNKCNNLSYHICRNIKIWDGNGKIDGKLDPDEFYVETYLSYAKKCYGMYLFGIVSQYVNGGCGAFVDENIVDINQCDLTKYTCKGTYHIINDKCWNLASRKCFTGDIPNNTESHEPECCSDVVDMKYCNMEQ